MCLQVIKVRYIRAAKIILTVRRRRDFCALGGMGMGEEGDGLRICGFIYSCHREVHKDFEALIYIFAVAPGSEDRLFILGELWAARIGSGRSNGIIEEYL